MYLDQSTVQIVLVSCLLVCYACLFILSFFSLLSVAWSSRRLSIPFLFFFLLSLCLAGRVLDFLMYPDFFYSTDEQDPTSIVIGSFPGYLLFSAYLVLVVFFSVLFNRMRNVGLGAFGPDREALGSVSNESSTMFPKKIRDSSTRHVRVALASFLFVSIFLYAMILTFYGLLYVEWYYGSRWRVKHVWHDVEAIFSSSLSLVVGVGFLFYGFLIIRWIQKGILPVFLRNRLLRLIAMALISTVLLSFRAVVVVLQLFLFHDVIGSAAMHITSSVFCDIVPCILMLIVFASSNSQGKRRFGSGNNDYISGEAIDSRESSVVGEEDVPCEEL